MNAPYGLLVVEHLSIRQITRIFSKIAVNKESGCWEWTAYIADGYGRLRWGNTMVNAHRLLYAWTRGPIPKGKGRDIPQLDHVVCDNTKCCNPSHVELVLPRVNILRGSSPVANHARKTHCKRGHELPLEPNVFKGNGISQRSCLICLPIDRSEYHQAMLSGPKSEEYRARRARQARKDYQKLHVKTYRANWSRERRFGPLREQVLEKDRARKRELRARLKAEKETAIG